MHIFSKLASFDAVFRHFVCSDVQLCTLCKSMIVNKNRYLIFFDLARR